MMRDNAHSKSFCRLCSGVDDAAVSVAVFINIISLLFFFGIFHFRTLEHKNTFGPFELVVWMSHHQSRVSASAGVCSPK